MDVHRVDERDSRVELRIDGYRGLVVVPGGVLGAFDIDSASYEEARDWITAEAGAVDGWQPGHCLAGRVDLPGGGVHLTWLTPSPEDLVEELRAARGLDRP